MKLAARVVAPRTALLLLIAVPALIAAGAEIAGRLPYPGPTDAELAARQEVELRGFFTDLLQRAARVADAALDSSPADATREAVRSPLGPRLEGVGLLDPALRFLSWRGMPAEPPRRFADPDWPRWSVRADGARTRLLVRGGPDAEGRLTLATFVIDSTVDDLRFQPLLPAELRRLVQLDVAFVDTEALVLGPPDPDGEQGLARLGHELARDGTGRRLVRLSAPDGLLLGAAGLRPVPARHRQTRIVEAGRAWSVVALLALVALLPDWRRIVSRPAGLALAAAAVVAGRGLLAWQEVPGRLLPRWAGAPGLYGSSLRWDLLASPADLVLTALGIWLLAAATAGCCARRGRRTRALVLLAPAAALASALALALAASIARNARVPLLARPAPFAWDGRLLLWAGLVLGMLAAARLWVAVGGVLAAPPGAPPRSGPLATALVLAVVAGASTVLLDVQTERLALEQLRHDFAPQVLEQSDRRRVTLVAALREIEESYRLVDELLRPTGERTEHLAYRAWVRGELFHSRYRSSLDFYTPAGELISHFGFDLPPLDETIAAGDLPEFGGIEIVEESFPVGLAEEQRALHAQVPLVRAGRTVAIAVAHVLDEPENLPFLPGFQPYLAALGPGAPRDPAESFAGGPHYVLYRAGAVVLSTLREPPATTARLLRAAPGARPLRLVAGGEAYLGLPLEDGDAVHLLLVRNRGPLERLAGGLRLFLAGLLVMALSAAPRLLRGEGRRAVARLLRRSFYRKLVAALLVASIVPLVGLALFLQGYLDRRADAELVTTASQYLRTARRVIQDFAAADADDPQGQRLDDALLYWLRRVVGQEIHVYEDGRVVASSKRELFASGVLPERLDGTVQRQLFAEGLPSVIVAEALGPASIPVAYGPVGTPDGSPHRLAVAVPLVIEERQIAAATARVSEMILLATVLLVALLAVAAAALARTVARPVRELVAATARIASGEYAARLEPRTHDEIADLVVGFNTMAAALARQRADIERRRDYTEALLRHATTGVISLDPAGRLVTVNPAARALLATWSASPEVGIDLERLLGRTPALEPLARAIGGPRAPGVPVEVDLPAEAGGPRRLRLVRVELRRPSGERFGTLILLDDVTDLMRSNQLAAWAEMARAIAHEIKNPLTPIQLSTEHLRRLLRDRGVAPSAAEEACLETIFKQVRALYDIAGEFSAFAKLPALSPAPTDPVAFLRGVIGPYRAANPPGITIVERYEPSPQIRVDGKVLGRAVVNLVENALQAMADGGTLRVDVRPVDAGTAVELAVGDSGPGLAPDVRRRLFEPYFSTKSSGTGLGLAIVRRAVEAHDGRIRVESEPGGGTTFAIRLPVPPAAAGVADSR